MQTIVERKGTRRLDLLGKVIEGFAKTGAGYEEFQLTVILPALGELKEFREMNEDELRIVLRDITGEDVAT